MNLTLTGVVPPVVTPLNRDRTFDVTSFERVINRMIDAGVAGVFVLGSTGEVAFCTDAMRRQVMTEARRVVAGRVPLIAGVIDTQTPRVLDHIRGAEESGVDAVVATAPFYAVTPVEQIARHFSILGRRSSLPVLAYDIPVCVGVKLDPDMLVGLGRQGLLAGVKDSSGDDVSFRRLALRNADAGSPLSLLTGHEVVVDGSYLSGANGSVPGLANVDPAGFVALDQAYRRGDWDAARREQDRLARLMEICFSPKNTAGWGAGVGAFKTALVLLNVIETNQLPEPFEALEGADVDAIRIILEAHGPRR